MVKIKPIKKNPETVRSIISPNPSVYISPIINTKSINIRPNIPKAMAQTKILNKNPT